MGMKAIQILISRSWMALACKISMGQIFAKTWRVLVMCLRIEAQIHRTAAGDRDSM
jgi:hypothetical protein